MSVRARISKPVGTPDIARSNTPLSVDTRARERERRRGTPPLVYYTHREPPLRGLCCLRFFQTGSTPPREFSFYLSERVESSNTARLSFSAASLSLSLSTLPAGPTTNASLRKTRVLALVHARPISLSYRAPIISHLSFLSQPPALRVPLAGVLEKP